MKLGSVKTAVIAIAGGALITALLYAIENLNLTGREPIELDIGALSADNQRKPLIAGFTGHDFNCGPEKSELGKTICWTEIASFNGIRARYLAFFFDADNQLTAFKLAAYADEHEQLIAHFSERFGPARQAPDTPFLAWPTGAGALTTSVQPPEGAEATVLWLNDPEVVREFTAPAQ
jgi:hypothetical protein